MRKLALLLMIGMLALMGAASSVNSAQAVAPAVNCGPSGPRCDGGGGYPPNMCRDVLSGHNTYINGHLFRCSYDWGSPSNWYWSDTYGFINGCPWNQNPCWY